MCHATRRSSEVTQGDEQTQWRNGAHGTTLPRHTLIAGPQMRFSMTEEISQQLEHPLRG